MHFASSVICFLMGLILYHQPFHRPARQQPGYKTIFRQAEELSNTEKPTGKTDALALKSYLGVIDILTKTKADNSFLLKTYIATGTFLQVLNRPKDAIFYFKSAFALKEKIPGAKDSLLFKPLVYCGNSYYQQDQPDTAEMLYKKAEIIAEKYPQISEVERLYNTLGVIAYATGNYNLSITYYEKAISVLTGHRSYNTALLVAYKNNLASAYRKLKRYDEALKTYKELLAYHVEEDKLLHNIGAVYVAMGRGALAITYLKRVKYEDQRKLNDLGRAYFEENDYDNALNYLQKASDLNKGHINSDHGITLKFTGDVWLQKNQVPKALTCYQQAINNLSLDFHSGDIYVNPTNFNSVFNAVELLDVLLAKAQAFKMLYDQGKNIKAIEASLQTYLSFYKLADHIERFYENDEARLLISDKKYESNQQPVDICLQLFKLTGNKKYIEQAFFLDEENKANTLSLYLQEAKFKAKSSIPRQLLNEETRLKENMTRLTLKASGETDNVTLKGLKNTLNEYSIQLTRVQQKIDRETSIKRHNLSLETVSVKALQAAIPLQSAVLSYHISNNSILCFIITAKNFDLFTAPLNPQFFSSLKEIYKQAQYRDGNTNKQIRALAQSLYKQLVKPAEGYIADKNDLLIIPDNELNYLPFELLVNDKGENLLAQYSVAYNYSCTILQNSGENSVGGAMSKLGMAPFDAQILSGGKMANEWLRLPASKKEIEALHGTSLFNKAATKQQFITLAHNFNIIHLATHAYANDQDPNKSFIAFYPANPDSAISYKLYQPEIYNLKLDKTRLVVLSACESGVGQLIKGEGLMSLSRAFSYAGCDNIITSMWKADDGSTAYISGKLHYYLQKGYSISTALKKAKLDYLDDDDISPAKKLPGFWAHMRLIGNFRKQSDTGYWLFYLSIVAAICFIAAIKSRGVFKRPRLIVMSRKSRALSKENHKN